MTLRGDRATVLVEDIWCEKIRGCSYREVVTIGGIDVDDIQS